MNVKTSDESTINSKLLCDKYLLKQLALISFRLYLKDNYEVSS